MMAWFWLKPKRPAWFVATASMALATVLLFGVVSWLRPWQPGRFWGLTFGTLAALVFVLDALYPLRRRLLSWPLGTAQRWLQFHLYSGVLALLFVFVHSGFEWPAGQLGWWLLGLSVWVVGTGLGGVWLQKWVPTVITGNLSVEAIYERIPEMVDRLQDEADRLVSESSEGLQQVYVVEVRDVLGAPMPTWAYLFDVRAGRESRMEPLRQLEPFLAEEERGVLADLETMLTEKLELDAHLSLQRALRAWLVLHAPPAMVLLGLIAVHVFAALYF